MVSFTIPITGMSCGGCVGSIRAALTGTPGVKEVQVRIGAASMTYDPARTNAEAIRRVIKRIGYTPAAA